MVVLYSNHCPLCNNLKDLLDASKVQYKEVNDVDAMLAIGIDHTPMLEVETLVDDEVHAVMLKYKDALKWIADNQEQECISNG